jgi:hypothetical protein
VSTSKQAYLAVSGGLRALLLPLEEFCPRWVLLPGPVAQQPVQWLHDALAEGPVRGGLISTALQCKRRQSDLPTRRAGRCSTSHCFSPWMPAC